MRQKSCAILQGDLVLPGLSCPPPPSMGFTDLAEEKCHPLLGTTATHGTPRALGNGCRNHFSTLHLPGRLSPRKGSAPPGGTTQTRVERRMLTLGLMPNTLPRDSQSQEGVRCHRDGRCSPEPKGSALPWEGEASPHATPSPGGSGTAPPIPRGQDGIADGTWGCPVGKPGAHFPCPWRPHVGKPSSPSKSQNPSSVSPSPKPASTSPSPKPYRAGWMELGDRQSPASSLLHHHLLCPTTPQLWSHW